MARSGKAAVIRSIRAESARLVAAGTTVAEFSSRFFGPNGLMRQLWSNEDERRELVTSELYKELQAKLADLRRAEAQAFEREVESASGRLTIVVPKSLHVALRGEAEREGISLSELIRLKLGVPYRVTTRLMLGRGDSEAA